MRFSRVMVRPPGPTVWSAYVSASASAERSCEKADSASRGRDRAVVSVSE
jgi:hypothetical protein